MLTRAPAANSSRAAGAPGSGDPPLQSLAESLHKRQIDEQGNEHQICSCAQVPGTALNCLPEPLLDIRSKTEEERVGSRIDHERHVASLRGLASGGDPGALLVDAKQRRRVDGLNGLLGLAVIAQ